MIQNDDSSEENFFRNFIGDFFFVVSKKQQHSQNLNKFKNEHSLNLSLATKLFDNGDCSATIWLASQKKTFFFIQYSFS